MPCAAPVTTATLATFDDEIIEERSVRGRREVLDELHEPSDTGPKLFDRTLPDIGVVDIHDGL
jgi:hypothetical protein